MQGARLPRSDRGRPSSLERKDGTQVKSSASSLPGFDRPTLPSKKTVRGRQGEAVGSPAGGFASLSRGDRQRATTKSNHL
jgi:hypothetical protein